jgi:hypothetical protein
MADSAGVRARGKGGLTGYDVHRVIESGFDLVT